MQKLSYKSITVLYLPLALSWVLMLMEAPLVNAFLARGPHPELSLAAYGVAMSIILVAEAPIIMMLELYPSLYRRACLPSKPSVASTSRQAWESPHWVSLCSTRRSATSYSVE